MLAREHLERQEYEYLSPYAAKSADSRGRKMPEEPCSMRTDFQRDRDRIIHSEVIATPHAQDAGISRPKAIISEPA